MRSLLLGALFGFVLAGVAVVALAWKVTEVKVREAQRGWVPMSAIVAKRDIAEGTPITYEDISERKIPEQFVTGSFVRPSDAAALIGKRLSVNVQAGDPLIWGDFFDVASRSRVEACVAQALPGARAAAEQARQEALREFASRYVPPSGAPQQVPPLEFDANGEASVVVVTRKLEEGQPIPASALKVEKLPRQLVTASVVPASALEAVSGAMLMLSLEPGDTLRWQYLDNARSPASADSCIVRALGVRNAVGAAAAKAGAKAFFSAAAQGGSQ